MRTGLVDSPVRATPTYNFYRKVFIAAALGALAVGCATAEPPEREMAVARTTVAQARTFAETDAPTQLADAQAKLARAEADMQRGSYEQARILAEQAEADAKLALAMSERARNQRALRAEQERRGQ